MTLKSSGYIKFLQSSLGTIRIRITKMQGLQKPYLENLKHRKIDEPVRTVSPDLGKLIDLEELKGLSAIRRVIVGYKQAMRKLRQSQSSMHSAMEVLVI